MHFFLFQCLFLQHVAAVAVLSRLIHCDASNLIYDFVYNFIVRTYEMSSAVANNIILNARVRGCEHAIINAVVYICSRGGKENSSNAREQLMIHRGAENKVSVFEF